MNEHLFPDLTASLATLAVTGLDLPTYRHNHDPRAFRLVQTGTPGSRRASALRNGARLAGSHLNLTLASREKHQIVNILLPENAPDTNPQPFVLLCGGVDIHTSAGHALQAGR